MAGARRRDWSVVGVIVAKDEMEQGLQLLADLALTLAKQADVGHIEVSVMRGRLDDYVTAYAWNRDSGDGKTCAEYIKPCESMEVPHE